MFFLVRAEVFIFFSFFFSLGVPNIILDTSRQPAVHETPKTREVRDFCWREIFSDWFSWDSIDSSLLTIGTSLFVEIMIFSWNDITVILRPEVVERCSVPFWKATAEISSKMTISIEEKLWKYPGNHGETEGNCNLGSKFSDSIGWHFRSWSRNKKNRRYIRIIFFKCTGDSTFITWNCLKWKNLHPTNSSIFTSFWSLVDLRYMGRV